MPFFRRFYRQHELSVKLGGFLAFLVVVASLYFFVFSGFHTGDASNSTIVQITPTQFGYGSTPVGTLSPVTFPTEPPASPTPPLLPPRYHVKVQADLPYYQTGVFDRELDLCSPVGAPGPRPGVILIHDIGTQVEDKAEYTSLCSLLASQGFIAAAINFRKYPNLWPDQLEDAQLAVRWLRANAGKYGLNSSHLCALGDSAGGHLAVFLGVLGSNYAGDEASLLKSQSPRVSCVVDEFGYVDLTTLPKTPFWQGALGFMFGQQNISNPGVLHNASPIFSVNSLSAPTLIVQGALDQTVPASQSQELQRALQQAGVPVSYISYAGGHSFSQLSQQQINAIERQIISYLTAREQP